MSPSAVKLEVIVKRLPNARGLPLPVYQTSSAAGMDLTAAIPKRKPIVLEPGARALVPTGLVLALPHGTEAQVRPRSGLALRHGITVLNSPGTIDADYRGEVQVLLVNLGSAPFIIERGERIAQLVFASVLEAEFRAASRLPATARGEGGFGSTGTAGAEPAGAAKRTIKKPARQKRPTPKRKRVRSSTL